MGVKIRHSSQIYGFPFVPCVSGRLLSASVELFDGTELVEELLVDEPRHQEELIVGHELVDDLLFHAFSL